MKVIFTAIIFALLGVAQVNAADVTLTWDPSTGATGYKVHQSENDLSNWDAGTDVGAVTTYTVTGVAEDRPVFFRVSAYNANGETMRGWSGAWFDYRLKPPAAPSGAGVE